MTTSLIRPAFRRAFFLWSRTIHIYVSAALFALLVFFCISGITLNHGESFGGATSMQEELPLPRHVADSLGDHTGGNENWPLSLTELQSYLAQEFDLRQPRSISSDREFGLIELDFPLPAGYAYATVDLEDNLLMLDSETGSFLALINDLHKGRHTGEVWSWVIDFGAGLMLVFAISGLILLIQLQRRRRMGLIIALTGAVTPLLLYWLFVPSFSH